VAGIRGKQLFNFAFMLTVNHTPNLFLSFEAKKESKTPTKPPVVQRLRNIPKAFE
jgi:hypothetical protein